jgi:hypothetical protein
LKDNPDAAGEIEVKLREALGLLPGAADAVPAEQAEDETAEKAE